MKSFAWLADLRYSLRHPAGHAGLWACAVAGGLMVAAIAFWWPTQLAHDRLNEEIGLKRRELVQVQQAEDLICMYARARKEAPTLEKKLAQAVSQAQLVQNLSRLARQRGARIVSETHEEVKGGSGQPSLISELAVQGSYRALRDFLRDLPSLPTWSEVQEVRLEAARGVGDVKGRIRIVTYRRVPAAESKRS